MGPGKAGRIEKWNGEGNSLDSEASDSDRQAFFHNGLALTPPMGWSSWNNYRSDITEADVRANADAMVSNGMKAAGYEYVDIDSGWFFNKRDANGEMIPDEKRFPSGMKSLADYIHSKGLKAGIYTDVGEKGCGEGGSAPQYYDRDAKQFAAWGYDLVKVDSCGANKDTDTMRSLYGKFGQAMLNAGRPMVYSICSQGEGEPWTWGPYSGNYWRDGHDVDYYNWINPSDNYLWEGVLYEIDRDAPHSDVAGPGHWNDPDMLPIGGVKGYSQPGGQFLSQEEEKTAMSMWAMLSGPLIVGARLPDIRTSSLEVLLNREVIAIDQDPDGRQAHLVEEQGPGIQVWEKPLHSSSDLQRSAVALLNRTEYVEKITYRASVAGHAGTFGARDLWLHSELDSALREYTATIPPHGTVLLMLLWNAH